MRNVTLGVTRPNVWHVSNLHQKAERTIQKKLGYSIGFRLLHIAESKPVEGFKMIQDLFYDTIISESKLP